MRKLKECVTLDYCNSCLFLITPGRLFHWTLLKDCYCHQDMILFWWWWISFSRYAHFISLAHPFTALDFVMAYLHNVYKLHGLSWIKIVYYQYVVDWAIPFGGYTTADDFSVPSSNWWSNGMGKSTAFVHACPKRWYRRIALTEFWYTQQIIGHWALLPLWSYMGIPHATLVFGIFFHVRCQI